MLLLAFFIIHGLSIILFAVIVYEFIHVHNKRVDLLHGLGEADVQFLLKGRRRTIILYALSVMALITYSSFQLFV